MTTLRAEHVKHRARCVDHEWLRKNPESDFEPERVKHPVSRAREVLNMTQSTYQHSPPYVNVNRFYKNHKFYRMLGVEHDAHRSHIIRQGVHMLQTYPRGSATRAEIQQAFDVLTDDRRRQVYNRFGDEQPAHFLPAFDANRHNMRSSSYQLPEPRVRDVNFDPKQFAKELKKLGKFDKEQTRKEKLSHDFFV